MLHKHLWTFLFLKTVNLSTDWLPLSAHIPSFKDCSYNLTKYESKWNSRISIFQLLSDLGEIWNYRLSQDSKIPLFHHFHFLKKFWSPTKAKLNPSFQYFSELGKRLKYSLRPKHKDSSFESKDNLKNYLRIWVSLLKIKGIYRK